MIWKSFPTRLPTIVTKRLTTPFSGRNVAVLSVFLFIMGILFSFWMFRTLTLHSDQQQMLEKAHLLLTTGEWTHFGSRGTGVGYIPGTLLTALYGLPLFVVYSPYAPMAVLLLFHIVGMGLFYFPVRKVFGEVTALFFLLLFWVSPWRLEQTELYNPGYLFLFSGLHFWSAYHLKDSAKFWPTAWHVIGIGLCAQIHFSVAILGLASLLLLYFQMCRVHIRGLLFGVFIVALSLLPYMLSLSSRPESGIHMDESSGYFIGRNFIYVYPILKSALYWLRYGSTYFARHIFTEINFAWIQAEWLRQVVSTLFHTLKWPLALLALCVSIKAQWSILRATLKTSPLKRVKGPWPQKSDREWVFQYALCLFIGMLLAAGLSPVEFNHWHLILCLPTSALIVSVWLTHNSGWKLKPIFYGLLMYFILHNSFAALGSRVHSYKNDYHNQVMKYFDSL